MIHCLFEQSGTYKNEFHKLGYAALDYDILNDFNETDNVVDLFSEIEKAYIMQNSIFDKMQQNDIVFAFFPCIRFEDQILLSFRGDAYQMRNYNDEKKLEYDIKLHQELHKMYELISKLTIISIRRGFRLIIENPYSESHYLKRYWCIKPALIDYNRKLNGDYFKKPTQYWFIGFQPSNNILLDEVAISNKTFTVEHIKKDSMNIQRQKARSLMSSVYANRFIRQFILNEKGEIEGELKNEKLVCC